MVFIQPLHASKNFLMPAVAHYRDRLVIDFIPAKKKDELLSFLENYQKEKKLKKGTEKQKKNKEQIIIAIDPGHGERSRCNR